MKKVENGDMVRVHYTLELEDGRMVGNSRGREPLEFKVGDGEVMPGIEEGVLGMEKGGKKSIEVPPEEAFGPRREDLMVQIDKNELPEYIKPIMGQRLRMQNPDGGDIDLTVVDMDEDTITLDANHPLAGQTLFFNLQLIDIT